MSLNMYFKDQSKAPKIFRTDIHNLSRILYKVLITLIKTFVRICVNRNVFVRVCMCYVYVSHRSVIKFYYDIDRR